MIIITSKSRPGAAQRAALMAVVGLLALAASHVVLAQVDLSGEWQQKIQEDEPERDAPQIGDYVGLPLSDAARMRADSWSAAKLTQLEHECEPHPADYAPRGPGSMHIWSDVDAHSQKVTAWHTEIMWMQPERSLYMDARAHPPAYAPDTWEGFSTAHWDADMLEVDTDHMKEGWPRRNGLPRSSRSHMKEFFIRHGDYLTLVSIMHDPVYFTAPYIISSEWVADPGYHPVPSTCTPTVEIPHPKGWVGYLLPGQNSSLQEYARRYGIPYEAVRGGAETMRPEYQAKLQAMPVPPPLPGEQPGPAPQAHVQSRSSSPAGGVSQTRASEISSAPAVRAGATSGSPAPSARQSALIDLTGYWMSIVDQDWRFRMVTAAPGDVEGIPINAVGMKVARSWDWREDGTGAAACRAYGAAGLMRLPERLHVHWADDESLQIDTDAGEQTRLLHFRAGPAPAPSLQGYSVARWFRQPQHAGFGARSAPAVPGGGGSLAVVTTHMTPAYLRSNGVPYSGDAKLLEFFDRVEDQGTSYLVLTSVVQDPTYLRDQYITSYEYQLESDDSHWHPQPCNVPPPTRRSVPVVPGL